MGSCSRPFKKKEGVGEVRSKHLKKQGLKAIRDYLVYERREDSGAGLAALFMPASSIQNSKGRLTPLVVNHVWDDVSTLAQVSGKTPHSARHAMGRHAIEKTGNIGAVQRQLGHRNVAYSVQYARVSNKKRRDVWNDSIIKIENDVYFRLAFYYNLCR